MIYISIPEVGNSFHFEPICVRLPTLAMWRLFFATAICVAVFRPPLSLGEDAVAGQPSADNSMSLSGLPGAFRAITGFLPSAERVFQSSTAGYFSKKGLTLSGEDHSGIEGRYALSVRPWSMGRFTRMTFAFSMEGRFYRLDSEDGKGDTTTLGNLGLGFTYSLWQGENAGVSVAVPILIPARPGGGPDVSAMSPEYSLAASFRKLSPRGALRHIFDINAGYAVDKTETVLKHAKVDLIRRTRLAAGAISETAFVARLAYSAQVPGRRATPSPFFEVSTWRDVDGKAINSFGEKTKLKFSANPVIVTPGLKSFVYSNLQADLAVDLGQLTGRFPDENEVIAPWRIWVGLAWLPYEAPGLHAAEMEYPREVPFATPEMFGFGVPAGVGGAPSSPAAVQIPSGLPAGGTVAEPAPPRPLPFAPYRTEVEGPMIEEVKSAARYLAVHTDALARVEGHTDSKGPKWYNKMLSTERAKSVVEFLVAEGIDASRLMPVGLADAEPIAPNNTREGRSKNRRVEIVIIQPAPWSIGFAHHRTKLGTKGQAVLDEIARLLSEKPGARLRIEGHSDGTGAEVWKALYATWRAGAVRDYLVAKGVDLGRADVVTYSDLKPVAQNTDPAGRAQNRRVDLRITE